MRKIRETDLSPKRTELENMMSPQIAKDTAEVVRKANEPNPDL